MLLGLGFTLARLGEVERGHDLCRQAAEAFPTDPRINECLQTEPPAEVVVGASLSSGYMSYSDPWELVDLLWLTATAGVELASGVGLWAGVTWARTSLNYELDDFVQTHPVLGLYVMKDGFEARLSGTYLFANDGDESAPIDGAWGLSGRVGYGSGDLAGYLDLAASVYSATTAVQLDPRLSWRLSDRVTLTLGPELQVLTAEGEVLGSGHVGADIRLNAILTMRLYGWGGTRRYAVEAGGLSVWTSADRYVGGYRAGLSVEVAAPLHLDFEWRHDFGDQQADEDHDFQLTGGTVNLRATF